MTDVDAMLDSLADDIDSLPDERKDLLMGKLEGHKTFTVPEVAELLALSETTIRRKLRDGEISGVQTGKGWRISRADLEAWWGEQGGETLFDDGGEGIRERISRLRQSIRASLEGDHDRAANILDTLEEGEPDG